MQDKEKEQREKTLKEQLAEDNLKAYCYFYYPNKSSLVMNALSVGLSSEQNKT